MKVDMGQGFYLARPVEKPQERYPKVERVINVISEKSAQSNNSMSNLLASLCRYINPIDESEEVSTLIERFKNENITSVTVVHNDMPVGFIDRTRFFAKLGQRFGYALFVNKTVRSVMISAMVFESVTPIEDVSTKVLSRDRRCIYDDIIVTKNGAYVGMVKIYDVLDHLTDQKIKMAVQANPLTGLPGNNIIKENIARRLARNEIFAVCYFDLDNFKPYNDHYGFMRGDDVIRFLGRLLQENIKNYDPRAFVGHIGGDDFVVVCGTAEVEEYCGMMISSFDNGVKQFHEGYDLESGYYTSKDRQGRTCRYPLLSLSIGVVSTQRRKFHSYGHLVSVASEVKRKAKEIVGSAFCIDHRHS
jgi:diguanylate cyclase (GGDEF)-like protein